MIEVGNSPDFDCSRDAESLARCRAHMTMWCIMKAPLILGSDLRNIGSDPTTFSVIAAKEVLAVNQVSLV